MRDGWYTATLKDLCVVDWGNTNLTKSAYVEDGEFLAVSAAGCDGRIGHKEHSKGTPVLSAIGAQCGKMFFPEEDFTAIKNTITLTPRPNVCDGKFLYYLFTFVELPQRGAGQPFISKGDIQSFSVSIPSLPEQKRIVAILDEAFAGIAAATANAEKNLANARELFDGLIDGHLFGPSQKTWKQTSVAKLAKQKKNSIRTGPFGSQLLHGEFVDHGIPVLGIDNVVQNRFTWGKRRYITEEKFTELNRYQVHPGDVLISIMGTCGRCAVVPDDIPVAINSKHLCCISLDQAFCLPGYLKLYFLHHPAARAYLEKKASGAIMAGLNMGIIKDMSVILPSIEEQREFIDRFDHLSRDVASLEERYNRKLVLHGELKQSILQKAFSGELNVKPDLTLRDAAE